MNEDDIGTPEEIEAAIRETLPAGGMFDSMVPIHATLMPRGELRKLVREWRGRQEGSSTGGPPGGDGLSRDRIVEKVVELAQRTPDGTWELPSQETTAEKLGCSPRRVGQVQGRRQWRGVREDALELLARK